MTDKPTDAELKAMWQLHAADIGGIFCYARAVLAKWGQPAQTGKAVATKWLAEMIMSDCGCSTENQRLLDRIIDRIQQYDRASAAPQPVALEPLTPEQIKTLMQAHRTAVLMTCKARVPECGEFAAIAQDLDWLCESLAIKGGQHGTDT